MSAAPLTRGPRIVVNAFVVALTGFTAATACTSISEGTPTPGDTSRGSESSTGETAEPETPRSLRDLVMCEILLPDDIAVRPDEGGSIEHEPEDDGDACTVTVQMSDVFDIITAKMIRIDESFSSYSPRPGSGDGGFTEISGREAWVGDPSSTASDEQCFAAFGAADGYLALAVTDETQRGVDPCVTAVHIVEKVISRTPAPYDR